MPLKLVNIGFGNIVVANRVVAAVSPDSAPIKRMVQEYRSKDRVLDATYGRRCRAVIVTDDDRLVLSSLQPETLANRIADIGGQEDDGN
ncbi:MAG: DUF370 domain-containing protein [Bacillota bacterium]|nr:DUF370 domain-containing protein [Bacillota bacterium]